MPWVYKQSTGDLSYNGVIVQRGYSGHGAGKNNPSMQSMRAVGPIPQGTYMIGAPRNSHRVGRYAVPLTPEAGTNTFGRNAFYMHGNSIRHPGTASEGCIIMNPVTRTRVWNSGDHELTVVQ